MQGSSKEVGKVTKKVEDGTREGRVMTLVVGMTSSNDRKGRAESLFQRIFPG